MLEFFFYLTTLWPREIHILIIVMKGLDQQSILPEGFTSRNHKNKDAN